MIKLLFQSLFTFLLFLSASLALAQDFKEPAEGRSLVYFIRTSGTGALINFRYFDGHNYLGKFSGSNYFIYECEPGKHIFWANAENRDFIEAHLLPNKVYIIVARPTVGMVKSAIKLIPVDPADEKMKLRIKSLIAKKAPLEMNNSQLDSEEENLAFYIKNGMKKYAADSTQGQAITQLTADMYHN
jgi:hypothetical protein